jgi:hypothetical protein
MTQDEIIEMAIEARLAFDSEEYPEIWQTYMNVGKQEIEIFAKLVAAKAIAKLESQEPVAWLLTEKNINSLQVDSIQLLINRLKHAHHTDLCVRINGQDEWFQADWLKHMVRATPPQRTWVGLTDEEAKKIQTIMIYGNYSFIKIIQTIEAKLKQKNGYAEEKNT